jgi:hypothetical protein
VMQRPRTKGKNVYIKTTLMSLSNPLLLVKVLYIYAHGTSSHTLFNKKVKCSIVHVHNTA